MSFDERLCWFGLRLAGWKAPDRQLKDAPDIEATLLDILGHMGEDGRLFSWALSWVKVHGASVIVEKLRKLSKMRPESSVVWLSALAALAVQEGMSKWRPLVKKQAEPRFFFPRDLSEGVIAMKGAVPWLKTLNLLLPEGSLRIRETDVLTPEQLAEIHRQYRNRYLFGPSWRADIVTAIEDGAKTPTEIMKRVGCSYEPAHRVLRELKVAGSKKLRPA